MKVISVCCTFCDESAINIKLIIVIRRDPEDACLKGGHDKGFAHKHMYVFQLRRMGRHLKRLMLLMIQM